MKKLFVLLLVVVMMMAMSACTGSYTKSDGTSGKAEVGEIVEDKTITLTVDKIDPVGGRYSSVTHIDYVIAAKNDEIVVVFRGDAKDYALLEAGMEIQCRYTIESSIDFPKGEKHFYYLGEKRTIEYFGYVNE